MALPSIDKLTLKELIELEGKVKKAIQLARERERSEVKAKIEAMAEGSGFSVSELFGGKSGRGKSVAVKYANPENKTETWTGRGRQPKWLVAKLAKGAKLTDFALR